MKNKLTVKRLLIYLFFSFSLVWIPTIVYMANGGEYDSLQMNTILTYSMLCPSIAMLLTRWFTKEGFPMKGKGNLELGIIFADKKWVFYLAAILLPFIYRELGAGLIFILFPESFNPAQISEIGISEGALWLLPPVVIASTCMLSVGALGEEAGWRGYMMPKLEELFGIKGAVLVGGIIWGVWHFPANMAGHNFGTGYWGEPWTGFVSFTLFTIAVGAILTYLTKKSGSVWPAAFLHAVNNGGGSILSVYFDQEKITGFVAEPPVLGMLQSIPLFIMGGIAVLLLLKEDKHIKED